MKALPCAGQAHGQNFTDRGYLLEVKGFETEQDRAKEVAARRWVRAVNHHDGFGTWDLITCREPHRMSGILEELAVAHAPH